MTKRALAFALLFTYALSAQESSTPGSEIDRIFDADQKERAGDDAHPDMSIVTVTRMIARDAERRKRVREMLDAGELKSAQDFLKASFIFQHGAEPDDYLLAHVLAMIAVAKGDANAKDMEAFTLDRYLQNIGKPIIFGPG